MDSRLGETANAVASYALDRFAALGAWTEEAERRAGVWGSVGQTTVSGVTQSAQVQSALNELYVNDVVRRNRHMGFDASFVERHFPSEFQPRFLGKSFAFAGGLLDSVTGVLSAAKEFKRDRERGDNTYSGTMRSIFSSVAQVSAASAVGAGVGAVVGAVSGTVAAPVIAGGLAAVAVGYGVGKALDYFFA